MKKVKKVAKPKIKKKMRVQDHPFFGSDKNTRPVADVIRELRRNRYKDI